MTRDGAGTLAMNRGILQSQQALDLRGLGLRSLRLEMIPIHIRKPPLIGASRFCCLATLLLLTVGSRSPSSKSLSDPIPSHGIEALIQAFEKSPLVALGESHQLQEIHDFITVLIRHPAFPDEANDIVVEWGNALYQDILDRYISGEKVSLSEIRQVWRNTTAGPLGPWDAPVYEHFFTTVRLVNEKLAPSRRLRVLAGDPPIDWTQVNGPDEVQSFLRQRDTHFATVVEKEVLAKGRKALLIMGSGHLFRNRRYHDLEPVNTNVQKLIERSHPGEMFVVMLHVGFSDKDASLEQRLASWPRPSLALLRGTWLGALEPASFLSQRRVNRIIHDAYPGMRLQDLADAYLYLGPRDSLTRSRPSPNLYRKDQAYLRELMRRRELEVGMPLDLKSFLEEKPKKYFND